MSTVQPIRSSPPAGSRLGGFPVSMSEHRLQPAGCASPPQNINQAERLGSLIGGSLLLLSGLKRGKLSGLLLGLIGGSLVHRGVTGHCYGYQALGINTTERHPATAVPGQQGVKVQRTIAIQKTPSELFSFWRDLENLPRVMRHLESVQTLPGQRSRWVAKGPLGVQVQWEAEIINERADELIAWRSLPDGDIDTAGSVHFKPLGHDRGTALTISLKYNPPAGKAGDWLASLLGGSLEQELDEDLRRFKSFMETRVVPTTSGQASGRV
jgi:uncharacterized membrane protein